MAILLAFLTNLTPTSFISCFIFKSDIKNESIKDMIINKKIYNERVERHKYLFSYHILNRSVPKSSLYLGAGHNKRDKK